MEQHLATREFFADELSIADFAILGWAWRHPRHKVDLADYPNVRLWYEAMMARPAVKRGRMVNRATGDPAGQLRERHDAGDFETRTQDKLDVV